MYQRQQAISKFSVCSQYNRLSIKHQHSWTFLDMSQNLLSVFVHAITQTTTKLSDFWMDRLMLSQFTSWTETFWTFTANIRLHTLMTTYMFLKAITAAELLLTNVARQPSTFIVWLQKMLFELLKTSKSVWTVSTWVPVSYTHLTLPTKRIV